MNTKIFAMIVKLFKIHQSGKRNAYVIVFLMLF